MNFMAQYSHSKLSTFEQCKLKYKFRYIDKIKPEIEQSIEAFLGSCVHSTLEWLYTLKKDEGKVPSIDDVIVHYTEVWQEGFSEDFLIVKESQGYNYKSYFDMGITFLLNYYMRKYPFNENTLALEKKINFNIGEKNKNYIIGFIDRLVHDLDEDTLEIHDYKTSNFLPSQEKMDADRQLALYSIAIKKEFGHDKKIKLIWHYLAHNTEIHSERTHEELEQLKIDINALIEVIESTSDFPYNKSALCDWCEYKSICPAWGNSPEKIGKDDKIDRFPTLKKYMKE